MATECSPPAEELALARIIRYLYEDKTGKRWADALPSVQAAHSHRLHTIYDALKRRFPDPPATT